NPSDSDNNEHVVSTKSPSINTSQTVKASRWGFFAGADQFHLSKSYDSLQICRKMYGFEALTFNIHGGYLEAIVRGYRSGLLTASDYNNLCQCETLEDIKMHLSATEYGSYLQNG
ncbi:V-type proton ATPase subunit d2, partial [Olea europaea subsp. europaea]